jgi:hypothetical protein
MVTIGIDPHKQTHSAVAVDELGVQVTQRTVAARLIDAFAIARAALREGADTLPAAKLAGIELEIRLIGLHRERLVTTRTRLMHDPQTAAYIQKQRERGKTNKEALRNLKRHLVRRVYHLLKDPQSVPITVCLT